MKFGFLIPVGVLVVWVLVMGAFVAFMYARRLRGSGPADHWKFARQVMIIVLVTIIGLAPQKTVEDPMQKSGADVFLLVDLTGSMSATDYQGKGMPYGGADASAAAAKSTRQRLDGVRADIHQLLGKLGPIQVTIVTNEEIPTQILPLTSDVGAALSWIDYTTVETPGASAGSALQRSAAVLARALNTSKTKHPTSKRLLFVFSDAENTVTPGADDANGTGDDANQDSGPGRRAGDTDATPYSWAQVAPLVSGGGAFLYGTSKGGHMPADPSNPNNGSLLQDPISGQAAVSHASPANMRQLAKTLHLTYVDRNSGGSLDSVVSSLKSSPQGDLLTEHPVRRDRDFIWPFVWMLIALIGVEGTVFIVDLRKYKGVRHV